MGQVVNVVFCGGSGVGNSSFINVLRNMGHDEPGSATSDVVECTMETEYYRHAESNVYCWDTRGFDVVRYSEHPEERP